MANRVKEDERNEKTIRGLSKLPPNRRCINCNNLGPQYVCTNFWTFICTNCSGIHREFTHRVKSISMAKFTSQEVVALQEGGNERAKEIYFKEWDPQRHSFPDSNNIDKLRDFVKHVYLDRRYTGERSTDRPPRVKGDREDYNENRKVDSYRSGSRSPPYDDRYNDQGGFGGRDELRSPGYDLGDNKRSPGRVEVVDERRRDDRYGNQNKRFEDRRFPDGVPKPEGRSPNRQNDIGASSPPMVQPLKDILGNDAPRLLVGLGDPPKPNGSKIPDNSTQTQRISSSSSLGSIEGTSVQLKRVNSGSLIDFNTDPEPLVPAQPRQSVPQQTTSSTDAGDWASFDIGEQKKAPQSATNLSNLESTLAELVAPGPAPGGNMPTLIGSIVASPQQANFDAGLMMQQQQQPSLFPAANNQFTNHQFNSPAVGSLNQGFQSWAPSQPSSLQASLIAPAGHPSQVIRQQETKTGVPAQTPSEAKPSGRKALPEDFFASLYPSVPTSAPGWQRGPLLGMGYAMQYPTGAVGVTMQYPTGAVGVTMPTYPHSSKSVNPFDLVNGPASAQAPTFPSMVPLQGALPNMTGPSPLSGTSGFGTSPRWVPQQQPVYPSAVSQSPYMMQQTPSNMPPQNFNVPTQMLHQGMGAPSFGGAVFGASDAPNSFSPVGGNPFG